MPVKHVPRLSKEELAEFITGCCDNTIFTSMHVHKIDKDRGDLDKIFLAIGQGIISRMPDTFRDEIGVAWQWVKEKTDRTYKGSVSGTEYPVFRTMRVIHKDDWDEACDGIKAEMQKRENEPKIIIPGS
jgi:hypothetical protein